MKSTLLLLLLLTFLSSAHAARTCGSLFEKAQTVSASAIPAIKFKRYDPSQIDQQIDFLLENGELEKFKKANARKTNLPYFEDYILDAVDRLIRVKVERNDSETTAWIDHLGVEAFSRIAQENLTYEWVIEFSYQALAIFEGGRIPLPNRNLNRIVNAFPLDIMIPTFAELDFKHFIEIEGKGFTFLGMREREQIVDGNEKAFTPEQFFNHDFLHYYLTEKRDIVLDPKNNFHNRWLDLHNKIRSKIADLPEGERRYVEYIYFYILHEEFGLRTKFLQRYLHFESGLMSEMISQMLEGSEIYKRTTNPNDFKASFKNTNPQEILLVGIGEFIKILQEVESTPAD
jgi:hypothetical protein